MAEQILPYFGGAEGEACRVAVVDAWRTPSTSLLEQLDTVMMNNIFQITKSYWQLQIDANNMAAGVVCLREASSAGKYNATYNKFWDQEDALYDEDYDLAEVLLRWYSPTANYTVMPPLPACVVDCYTPGVGLRCIEYGNHSLLLLTTVKSRR